MPISQSEVRVAGEPRQCGPSLPCSQSALLDKSSTGKGKLILDWFGSFHSFENNGTWFYLPSDSLFLIILPEPVRTSQGAVKHFCSFWIWTSTFISLPVDSLGWTVSLRSQQVSTHQTDASASSQGLQNLRGSCWRSPPWVWILRCSLSGTLETPPLLISQCSFLLLG